MTRLRDAILPLSYQRGSADRDELINQSLAWSRIQSERLLQWSTSNDRGRLVAMRFHQEWRHDQCPMTIWYNQQSASSTRFQSIEHRKNIQGPFFHEFLVLNLADGAVCRVERIGDGSRADAIRSIGCTSYDLIQWFAQSDHSAATNGSETITRVDFGRDFDILDVLAVCYSIQQIKACSVYTLQRYNCYFLCLTVLAVLTRRVASWETIVTADHWDSCVTAVLDGLSNLSSEESSKHLIMRICKLLEPDNPQAATFIIDGLRANLSSTTSALADYQRALCGMLWQTSTDAVLGDSLFGVLKSSSIDSLFAGDGSCATQLRRAVQMSQIDAKIAIVSNKLLVKHYVGSLVDSKPKLLDKIVEVYHDNVHAKDPDYAAPFGKLVFGQIGRFFMATDIALSVLDPPECGSESDFESIIEPLQFSQAVSRVRQAWSLARVVIRDDFGFSNEHTELFHDKKRLARRLEAVLGTTAILDRLNDKGVLGPSETSLVLSHSVEGWHAAEILCSFVTPNLGRGLRAILESQPNHIRVCSEPKDEPSRGEELTTVAEFQESYVHQRIYDHAKRVDTHQLAASPLVCQDIENTMAEVWRSLPPGFGSVVNDSS